ncbi:MAG: Xaa-Pro peptidase family protein [Candidatus Omnitrophota bacterium]
MTRQVISFLSKLKEEKLDGVLITKDENISYLTGYDSRESWLLVSPKGIFFFTDFRYFAEAKIGLKGISIVKINGSIFSLVARFAKKLNLKQFGFESKNFSYAEYKKLKEELSGSVDFVPTFDLIESLREIKTKDEIKKIRRAIKINIEGFKFIEKVIKPGLTERDLGFKLDDFIKAKGADLAFETIVASGVNSAYPHARISRRKLKKNEPVLIDFGVAFHGYRSDLTRIFFLGRIPLYFKRLYSEILAAQQAAIKKIAAGVRVSQIDKCARNFLSKKKLAKYFGHSLGHGIGRETHESPPISSKIKERLSEGMVFTVEPAIYLPGKFGIRIEDIVLVKKDGCEVLSDSLDNSIKTRFEHSD